jgi:hypothetical protein
MAWVWAISQPCSVFHDGENDIDTPLDVGRTWFVDTFAYLIAAVGGTFGIPGLSGEGPVPEGPFDPNYPISYQGKWQVIEFPNGYQYCFLWNTIPGQQVRIAFSKSGSFVYDVGDDCANAPDEVVLCGGGTSDAPEYLSLWTTNTADVFHMGVQSEAPYGFFLATTSSVGAVRGAFLVDPIVPSSFPDTDTTVPLVGYFDTEGSNAWSPPGANEGVAERTDGAWFNLSALRLVDANGSAHLPVASGEHPENGFALVPPVWSRRLPSDGDPWVKGVGSCPWAPAAAHGNGARYATADGMVFAKFGQVTLPWPTDEQVEFARADFEGEQTGIGVVVFAGSLAGGGPPVDAEPLAAVDTNIYDGYFVYGEPNADGAAPTVEFVAPANALPASPMVIRVTAGDALQLVEITVEMPISGVDELAYHSGKTLKFPIRYAGSSVSAIAGGYEISIVRAGGWTERGVLFFVTAVT